MDSYKQAVAQLFDAVAADYDQLAPPVFGYFGRVMVEKLALTPTMRVLDVGAGRGATLFPLAARVGQVIGIDLAPQMVSQTQAEIHQRGLTNAIMQVGDAENLAFPDASFEVVICAYSLFFFEGVAQALSEMRRVLRDGGQLVLLTWGKQDERYRWLAELVRQHFPPDFVPPRLWRAPGLLNKPHEVEALLQTAGFQAIQQHSESYEQWYPDETVWWRFYQEFAGRLPMSQLSETQRTAFKAEVLQKLAALRQPEGIPQQYLSHLTVARK